MMVDSHDVKQRVTLILTSARSSVYVVVPMLETKKLRCVAAMPRTMMVRTMILSA